MTSAAGRAGDTRLGLSALVLRMPASFRHPMRASARSGPSPGQPYFLQKGLFCEEPRRPFSASGRSVLMTEAEVFGLTERELGHHDEHRL
jgi:hypothetical protein